MDEEVKENRPPEQEKEKPVVLPKKKRKREPEVTIAPTTPGGPDISVG